MGNRERKIEKINAYKRMLETKKLPKIPDDKAAEAQNPDDPTTWPIEQQIHAEFTAWAEKQLAGLLGEGIQHTEPSAADVFDVFSMDQIEVLQQFADKMLAKAAVPAPAPAPEKPQPARRQAEEQPAGYRPPTSARPLGNRVRDRETKQYTKETSDYLAKLERMDRETPEFD